MQSAGRILQIHRGNWASGSNYERMDSVLYNGSSYIAKNSITNSTINPLSDTTNWQLYAQGNVINQIITKTSDLINDKQFVSESQLSTKADVNYVDTKISTSQKTVINYTGTLAALQSDGSADVAKNYLILNSSDTTNYGYVCYYKTSTSTWVSGWKFQDYGISSGEIFANMLSDGLAYDIRNNILAHDRIANWIKSTASFDTYIDTIKPSEIKGKSASTTTFTCLSQNQIDTSKNYIFSCKFNVTYGSGNRFLFGFQESPSSITNTNSFVFGYSEEDGGVVYLNNGVWHTLESNSIDKTYALSIGRYNNQIVMIVNDNVYFTQVAYNTNYLRIGIKSATSNFTVTNLNFKYLDRTILRTISGKRTLVYKFGGGGNDWCFVRTPSNYNPDRPVKYPFVICNHGNGWVMDGTLSKANWTKRTMYVTSNDPDYISDPTQYNVVASNSPLLYSNPTIEALLNAGYIVCGCENYADNLFGNDNCRQACQSFFYHITENYNVEEKCYMIGASNGGLTSLNAMYILGGISHVKAMILQYPITCLWRHYSNYIAHQSDVEVAYNISTGLTEAQFEKATRTHDPEKVDTIINVNGVDRFKTGSLPPIKIWYSLGDSVAVPSNNSIAFAQLLEDSNCIYETVEATGNHGDYTHFAPEEYVNWFDKWK